MVAGGLFADFRAHSNDFHGALTLFCHAPWLRRRRRRSAPRRKTKLGPSSSRISPSVIKSSRWLPDYLSIHTHTHRERQDDDAKEENKDAAVVVWFSHNSRHLAWLCLSESVIYRRVIIARPDYFSRRSTRGEHLGAERLVFGPSSSSPERRDETRSRVCASNWLPAAGRQHTKTVHFD